MEPLAILPLTWVRLTLQLTSTSRVPIMLPHPLYPRSQSIGADGQEIVWVLHQVGHTQHEEMLPEDEAAQVRLASKLAIRLAKTDLALNVVNAALNADPRPAPLGARLPTIDPPTSVGIDERLREIQLMWLETQSFYITAHDTIRAYGYVASAGDPKEIFIRRDVSLRHRLPLDTSATS